MIRASAPLRSITMKSAWRIHALTNACAFGSLKDRPAYKVMLELVSSHVEVDRDSVEIIEWRGEASGMSSVIKPANTSSLDPSTLKSYLRCA